MRERFANGFDPFVIPFLIGMAFVLGYCLVAMIRVYFQLPKPDRKRFLVSLVTPKTAWKNIKDIFLNEAQIPEGNETATIENVAHVAMLLFAGYIDAATSLSESCGGGGGSAPESGWGKKEDEDERAFARRCLQMAHSMCKPKSIKRGYHR